MDRHLQAAFEARQYRKWYQAVAEKALPEFGLDPNRNYYQNPPTTDTEKRQFAVFLQWIVNLSIMSPQADVEPNYEFSIRADALIQSAKAAIAKGQYDNDIKIEQIVSNAMEYVGGTKTNSFALNMLAGLAPE